MRRELEVAEGMVGWRPAVALAFAFAAGVGLGAWLGRAPARPDVAEAGGEAGPGAGTEPGDLAAAAGGRTEGLEETRRATGHRVGLDGGAGPREASPESSSRRPGEGLGPGSPAERVAQLREQLSLARADRRELFGEPVERPGDEALPRHQGPRLTQAFRAALEEEGVGGAIEGVDCSEYPCIVFGRLEGDEEDVEELERSGALAAYEEDVLTLLLWAVSREEGEEEAADEEPETALFAMAFITPEERAEMGERLQRRIRARVVEVWNSDRPGPGAPAPDAE